MKPGDIITNSHGRFVAAKSKTRYCDGCAWHEELWCIDTVVDCEGVIFLPAPSLDLVSLDKARRDKVKVEQERNVKCKNE